MKLRALCVLLPLVWGLVMAQGPEDTGPEETFPEDTGPEDTGPEDTGPEDTGTGGVTDGVTTCAAALADGTIPPMFADQWKSCQGYKDSGNWASECTSYNPDIPNDAGTANPVCESEKLGLCYATDYFLDPNTPVYDNCKYYKVNLCYSDENIVQQPEFAFVKELCEPLFANWNTEGTDGNNWVPEQPPADATTDPTYDPNQWLDETGAGAYPGATNVCCLHTDDQKGNFCMQQGRIQSFPAGYTSINLKGSCKFTVWDYNGFVEWNQGSKVTFEQSGPISYSVVGGKNGDSGSAFCDCADGLEAVKPHEVNIKDKQQIPTWNGDDMYKLMDGDDYTRWFPITSLAEYVTKENHVCMQTTGDSSFPVGSTLEEAIAICKSETNLGGNGPCIGVMPRSDEYGAWSGCLAYDPPAMGGYEGRTAYLLNRSPADSVYQATFEMSSREDVTISKISYCHVMGDWDNRATKVALVKQDGTEVQSWDLEAWLYCQDLMVEPKFVVPKFEDFSLVFTPKEGFAPAVAEITFFRDPLPPPACCLFQSWDGGVTQNGRVCSEGWGIYNVGPAYNDQYNFVDVSPGCRAIVYEHDGFSGAALEFRTSGINSIAIGVTSMECDCAAAGSKYQAGAPEFSDPNIVVDATPLGCFYDNSERDFPISVGRIYPDENGGIFQKCLNVCKGVGAHFMAIQDYSQCFCGNGYGKVGKADSGSCFQSCGDETGHKCGGWSANSIYSINWDGSRYEGTQDVDAVVQTTERPQETIYESLCSPNCYKWMLGDGYCDAACNTVACGYDNGDCFSRNQQGSCCFSKKDTAGTENFVQEATEVYTDDFTVSTNPDWVLTNSDLQTFDVAIGDGTLSFKATGGRTNAENQQAMAQLNYDFGSPNLIVKYKVKVDLSQGRESKLTVAPGIVLRRPYWSDSWVWSVSNWGFSDIGSSSLRTGSGEWLEIEQVLTATSVIIKENGMEVARYQLPYDTPFDGKLYFYWQHLDLDSQSEAHVSELHVSKLSELVPQNLQSQIQICSAGWNSDWVGWEYNDMMTNVEVTGNCKATIFQHGWYDGQKQELSAGSYDFTQPEASLLPQMSSFQCDCGSSFVPAPMPVFDELPDDVPQCCLFESWDTNDKKQNHICSNGWVGYVGDRQNDRMTTVKISDTCRMVVYQDSYFGGARWVLEATEGMSPEYLVGISSFVCACGSSTEIYGQCGVTGSTKAPLPTETSCNPECYEYLRNNGACDQVCNSEECGWDNGACYSSAYYGQDKATDSCSEQCTKWMGDSLCDPECNITACFMDGGDCADLNADLATMTEEGESEGEAEGDNRRARRTQSQVDMAMFASEEFMYFSQMCSESSNSPTGQEAMRVVGEQCESQIELYHVNCSKVEYYNVTDAEGNQYLTSSYKTADQIQSCVEARLRDCTMMNIDPVCAWLKTDSSCCSMVGTAPPSIFSSLASFMDMCNACGIATTISGEKQDFFSAKEIGCYNDQGFRALSTYGPITSSDQLYESCLNYCGSQGYKYMSLEFMSECYCGNECYDRYGKAEDYLCSPCGDAGNNMCGGSWTMSVYEIAQTFVQSQIEEAQQVFDYIPSDMSSSGRPSAAVVTPRWQATEETLEAVAAYEDYSTYSQFNKKCSAVKTSELGKKATTAINTCQNNEATYKGICSQVKKVKGTQADGTTKTTQVKPTTAEVNSCIYERMSKCVRSSTSICPWLQSEAGSCCFRLSQADTPQTEEVQAYLDTCSFCGVDINIANVLYASEAAALEEQPEALALRITADFDEITSDPELFEAVKTEACIAVANVLEVEASKVTVADYYRGSLVLVFNVEGLAVTETTAAVEKWEAALADTSSPVNNLEVNGRAFAVDPEFITNKSKSGSEVTGSDGQEFEGETYAKLNAQCATAQAESDGVSATKVIDDCFSETKTTQYTKLCSAVKVKQTKNADGTITTTRAPPTADEKQECFTEKQKQCVQNSKSVCNFIKTQTSCCFRITGLGAPETGTNDELTKYESVCGFCGQSIVLASEGVIEGSGAFCGVQLGAAALFAAVAAVF